MGNLRNIVTGLADKVVASLRSSSSRAAGARLIDSPPQGRHLEGDELLAPGQAPGSATRELDPGSLRGMRIVYAPSIDGDPDAGEIIWTWVPYVENDGRGKDRPVLVIGRESDERVYAVKLTSKARDGDRDFIPIGSGPWDSQGRESWVDIDQLYSVHAGGMRREAAVLDIRRFAIVAEALIRRHGWRIAVE